MTNTISILPIKKWFPQTKERPLFIAGPCSAESEQQIVETAIEIDKIGRFQIFRAGLWKPRTRPLQFEGVGNEGFNWLEQVKKQTSLLTMVEVATPQHVEECLRRQGKAVDILWIGARTTAHPFAMQQIADALRGSDIPVMVKNPMNPDIALWVGALERLSNAGITKMAAIHRGFFPYEETSLRNIPKWEIAIELKSMFPKLAIINDPSHIAGSCGLVEAIAQKALDLNFDGLMIETHINPKVALSDAKQQLSPAELKQMMERLNVRKVYSHNMEFTSKLEQYREQIDSIDTQLLELLSKRMNIVGEIGKYKIENNVTIFQLKRWTTILETRNHLAKKLGINLDFVKKLLDLVHEESIRIQNQHFI